MAADNLASIERIPLLRVPLDILPREKFTEAMLDLLKNKGGGNIVLLSLWDLLKARRNKEYRNYLMDASLVIPISKSLVGGARFLTGKTPVRYMPFDFVVELLTFLEEREYSVYLLGGIRKTLQKTEKNLIGTFPRLRIVGRHIGAFKRHAEGPLLVALHKAAPALLLVGKGVRGEERWIARNYTKLGPGLRLWCSDLFDIIALKKRRPSQAIFDRGLEWIGFCFQKPLRCFRIFPYIYYKFLLLSYKIRRINNRPLKPIPLK